MKATADGTNGREGNHGSHFSHPSHLLERPIGAADAALDAERAEVLETIKRSLSKAEGGLLK